MKKRILVIDDDMDMCTLLQKFLTRKGYEVEVAFSGSKGITKFKESRFDIVLCDYRLGDRDGRDILIEIKTHAPETIVLIITGYSDIKTAVDVIKCGAYDYITKPLIPDEIINVLDKALNQHQAGNENTVSGTPAKSGQIGANHHTEFMVGQSAATRELYSQIAIVAPTNYSIILYGESGTGKEVIAKTIHSMSDRKDKPFIPMDCGTLSKELAGSELFGHVKGAFTGALADKEGHFEMANGGTLFLDEVANLSPEVQASLLRVIQERKYKRVGGNKEMPVDVRIIVASNENLQNAYRKGTFREDLYHRFNEFSINLPPLRSRKEDIPLFAQFFLNKTNAELGKEIEGYDDEVINMFNNYSWPGNLREFRNVVRRALLLTPKGKIAAKVLPWEITNPFPLVEPAAGTEHRTMPVVDKSLGLKDTASRAEYDAIMEVLKQVNFNKTKAAEILKIDRKTLYNKIRIYEESSN